MLVNILIVTLVAAYCAIVLLGHILLLVAIWRGPASRRPVDEAPSPSMPKPAAGWTGGKLAA